jgi:hypothetical protein
VGISRVQPNAAPDESTCVSFLVWLQFTSGVRVTVGPWDEPAAREQLKIFRDIAEATTSTRMYELPDHTLVRLSDVVALGIMPATDTGH